MCNQIKIIVDYREVPSKIPELLKDKGAFVELQKLNTGDFLINNDVIVERKTKEDFVLSIIQGRLFAQCSHLKKTNYHQMILIEGNPYTTHHDIDRQAVKGALLSVSLSWQIPIMYSSNPQDSADMLLMAGQQLLNERFHDLRRVYKPKRIQNKAMYFIQGLPGVGPMLAKALLEQFGTLENIMLASEEELKEVEGLGKTKARKVRLFLRMNYKKKN
jgi:Fanconi anemia group M protein